MVGVSVFAICMVCGLTHTAVGQPQSNSADPDEYVCAQSKTQRDELIDEAEREYFNVRHVEFVGNTYTRGRDLFKNLRAVIEGDIFTRKNLVLSLKRVSKMRAIYPVTLDGVEVRLDRQDKSINITICVKQRPKK